MTSDAVTVLREALSLPDSDRAGLAAELLASLPSPSVILDADSEEWAVEIERRASAVVADETATEDWDSVEERILGQLSNG